MGEYQVLARKYRPQRFEDILGQDPIITTLKNAIKFNRLAHAYLFCGSRGTGKTTLARVFAKALNCEALTADFEPCNKCHSCLEITSGYSLDVLEIDGASHRGIDDVRQINETVSYAASSGRYKIYIIDEVHMLTKEAFNALLKTLEEPPPKVKFFFATTEPQKVLPTILSRCQRFNLHRISQEKIIGKLKKIALDLDLVIEDSALLILANQAEGGLRDAESLLDQIYAFHEGPITVESVTSILGLISKETLFFLDRAGKAGDYAAAFEIAHKVFCEGKDLSQFISEMTDHFRSLLLIKLGARETIYLSLSESDRQKYEASATLYSQEQCMTIVELLLEAQQNMRFQTSPKIALEALLLKIMKMHQRIPIELIVRRLAEMEKNLQPCLPTPLPPPLPPKKPEPMVPSSLSIDPSPTAADLGRPPVQTIPSKPTPPIIPAQKQSRYDTILQFAAVELEGSIQKHHT